jgi:hypothetical protein
MGRPIINLVGQKFGRLTVIERDNSYPSGAGKSVYWKCKCDCGNYVSVHSDHLKNGTTSSCGCLNSSGEESISKILQNNSIKYQTQYSFEDLKGDFCKLRFDFAIFKDNRLYGLIEFQGSQHYKKWGNESEERFQKRIEYDNKKRKYCLENNINLMEISYQDQSLLSWEYLQKRMIKEWK